MTPRSKKISAQMRAESRDQLIAAARKLFAKQGYFNTKVSDLANEAGMSQGNVYWYFKSKEDLLKAVLAEGFEALEQMTADVAASTGTASEKIDYLLEQTIVFYSEQGNFTNILNALIAHGGTPYMEELGFEMTAIGARYHGNLGQVFAQAREENIVADVDPNILVMFFFALFNGLLVTYSDLWPTLPPNTIRQAALRLLGCEVL